MSSRTVLSPLYEASSADSWVRSQQIQVRLDPELSTLTWDVPTPFGVVSMVLRSTGEDRGLLTARGESENLRRILRNALVRDALLEATPHEHHVLNSAVRLSGRSSSALSVLQQWARRIQTKVATAERVERGDPSDQEPPLHGFWWDRKANFGDAVGPWLAAVLSSREVVNVRPTKDNPVPSQGRAIALVGSIIHMINRPEMDIWGAGLMRPLSAKSPLRRLTGIRVHAVRGHLTRNDLREKLGWEVPEVLGDPALLLARHYTPRPSAHAEPKIAFVPHMSHRPHFKRVDPGTFDIIDVRDDLTLVVDGIANARVCVSTSLHGLIVAQAYGVPWVWLNITDAELGGGDFKFNDFFSTLRGPSPARVEITVDELPDLDLALVARHALLPELATDLDALEAAFPGRSHVVRRTGGVRSALRALRTRFARS
ncbi:polysaccharide pyruvyl transferase family protein [Nesterenkonia sp. Act20]|uniref:polysaccharide pyruvyl transferase family protein n=1 Tax=Nesterenkonia sp. Act20 TaxID=1483432 RepID=UPI001C44905D|nr:polysaccharide pyruvyl transferase family protein [Nesterenkonia sp. Act20]